jgi:flagellar motor switch protein FliN/FliY
MSTDLMTTHDEMNAAFTKAQQAVDSLTSMIGEPNERRAIAASPPIAIDAALPPELRKKVARLLRLRVPVAVKLADRTMPLREILKLAPGTIVEFERPVDAHLDLLVNNYPVAAGEAVKINEHFGLRLHRIGSQAERVASLSPSPS